VHGSLASPRPSLSVPLDPRVSGFRPLVHPLGFSRRIRSAERERSTLQVQQRRCSSPRLSSVRSSPLSVLSPRALSSRSPLRRSLLHPLFPPAPRAVTAQHRRTRMRGVRSERVAWLSTGMLSATAAGVLHMVIVEKTGLCLQIEGPYSSYCWRVWHTLWNSGVEASIEPPNHTANRCMW